MSDAWVKAIVMVIVSVAWLAYVGSELARGRQPEIWTWGILTGVFAALYYPQGARKLGRGQNDGGAPPGKKRRPAALEPDEAGDEAQ